MLIRQPLMSMAVSVVLCNSSQSEKSPSASRRKVSFLPIHSLITTGACAWEIGAADAAAMAISSEEESRVLAMHVSLSWTVKHWIFDFHQQG